MCTITIIRRIMRKVFPVTEQALPYKEAEPVQFVLHRLRGRHYSVTASIAAASQPEPSGLTNTSS